MVEEEEEEVEPVVFLLGWEGSKDEELVVYSRLYESLGCITVRYSSEARFLYTAHTETTNITSRQGLTQRAPLSLVEECRGSSLIARELPQ